MGWMTYAVLVEDEASEETAHFAVEASSVLIACTRAAMRLFGPEAETRAVYGCALCGEVLWEEEGLDSSGFRFCADCSPGDLEVREEQEPVGLAVKTARISATALAPLPGDAPVGALTVLAGDLGRGLEPGEVIDDDREVRSLLESAAAVEVALDDAFAGFTVKDDAGAIFRYRLAAAPVPADDITSDD
jgi:hypothetical protein